MAAKKLNDLSALGNLVYSTGETSSSSADEPGETAPLDPTAQNLSVHLEKKGRGGKAVVIVRGLEAEEEQAKLLAKALKNHCATGGAYKDGEIVIQGQMRDKVMDYLREQGFGVKRVGG